MNHALSAAPTAIGTLRASACPGLLRIVAARDGGICRIRLPGGVLSHDEACAIADAAEAHASGLIELTNRANLQIRGVRADEAHALIERLLAAGLGPRASADDARHATDAPPANPAADDVRNVMLSPTAGCDRAALFDTTGLAAQILTLLQSEARFAALSPKFALLLDGGEQLAMLGHPHDIWLAALQNVDGSGPLFAFGLAGCPPLAPDDLPALGAVRPEHVVELVDALLHAFLDLAAADDMRMRDLLARMPAAAVLSHIGARVAFPLSLPHDASVAAWRRPQAQPSLRFGAHAQRTPGMSYVGGAPPLGRIDAPTLRELAALAQDAGNGTLRVTPWQSVLLPDVRTEAAPAALLRLASLGFACDGAQPFARLIACTGSSGCAKGHADTKADARALATRLPANVEVHLSGCTRSCAAAHPVPFTLLAVAPGRYDLYQRDVANRSDGSDGSIRDSDSATEDASSTGFGHCIAHHLTIEHAADLLERLPRSFTDA
ncbi:precorrin-3B synthase [Paraburkholderia edwinii]|uniref:precorrin-3B synthase n=1 Tax=Paraburkholderia edwinii TaxID=2861782 RepID=UPI001FEBB309|nr:precorrin-3B synthase [Paraburkholderia edwinii]